MSDMNVREIVSKISLSGEGKVLCIVNVRKEIVSLVGVNVEG